jgi:hypothetical protein
MTKFGRMRKSSGVRNLVKFWLALLASLSIFVSFDSRASSRARSPAVIGKRSAQKTF